MRRFLFLAALAACHPHVDHVNGGALGRVVVYRNGVAFYERHATVEDGKLVVHVPRERVDDFLKSLTVVDPVTREPLAVTIPRTQEGDNTLTMTLETPERRHADVLLTYVTESPAWKPSYRVVVGKDGKVMLEGWAIVDNTTSEDWTGVKVGVGASSALAFRYDLWSVRKVDRDLLAGEERLAIAPPQAVSPYETEEVLALSDGGPVGATSAVAGGNGISGVVTDNKTGEKLAGVTVIASGGGHNETAISDEQGAYAMTVPPGTYTVSFYYADSTIERNNVVVGAQRGATVVAKIDQSRSAGEVVMIADRAPSIDPTSTTQGIVIHPGDKNEPSHITGVASGKVADDFGGFQHVSSDRYQKPEPSYEAPPPPKRDDYKDVAAKLGKREIAIELHGNADAKARLLQRAEAMRAKLVDDGVAAAKIHVVERFDGGAEGLRVVSVTPGSNKTAPPAGPVVHGAPGDNPVGESHFMADRAMTVKAGTSAMVAMVHGETSGGVVYLYDPIGERGDTRFAFKAVKLDNPTPDTLEPGPVTVYGDGRFIGEGITEPVPPHASVVVPFALDKEIVVERTGADEDRIAKLVTAQRGVVTAELQHRRRTELALTSRLDKPAKVFIRHRLESGWTLTDAPSEVTHVGDSQLFAVELAPGEHKVVVIGEATPIERTFDLASDQALSMMQVYVDDPEAPAALKTQLTALLATHRVLADDNDKIATLRDQLGEYRTRAGELHAQLVSLKLVKTSGDLMDALRGKLRETSERIQKLTIAVVDTQEHLMLQRVKFQNQLADLRLGDAISFKDRPRGR